MTMHQPTISLYKTELTNPAPLAAIEDVELATALGRLFNHRRLLPVLGGDVLPVELGGCSYHAQRQRLGLPAEVSAQRVSDSPGRFHPERDENWLISDHRTPSVVRPKTPRGD